MGRVAAVACGRQHTVAVTEAGVLLMWGLAGRANWPAPRQLDPSRVPLLGGLGGWRIVSVACGERHSAVVSGNLLRYHITTRVMFHVCYTRLSYSFSVPIILDSRFGE